MYCIFIQYDDGWLVSRQEGEESWMEGPGTVICKEVLTVSRFSGPYREWQ